MFRIALIFAFVTFVVGVRLGSYDVDPNEISVSGISAGAAMAIQMHVAYSSTIKGVGSFAGVPYNCARKSLMEALYVCMAAPGSIDMDQLIIDTEEFEAEGTVDPTSNLNGDPVYIYHGTADTTVRPKASDAIETYYNNFGANILYVNDMNAGHGQPTEDYGVMCSSSSSPYINRCSYDGAYYALNHIYGGNLIKPTGNVPLNGDLTTFDQLEFINKVGHHFADDGYIYVPSGCSSTAEHIPKRNTGKNVCDVNGADRTDCGFPGITQAQCEANGCCYREDFNIWCYHPAQSSGKCKLHIVFHGCVQGSYELGDEFVKNTGYLEVGELNHIIMVFPQSDKSLVDNPNGCFDWWGFEDSLSSHYATNTGPQMIAVKGMIDRILGN